jgi:hypothetical protein
MTIPMLSDFALRLAGGLAVLLLMTSWREVPLAFYRTHCQVILGLLVLSALDAARVGVEGPAVPLLIAAGVCAYLATVSWGMGVPRIAVPATALVVFLTVRLMIDVARGPDARLWALNASGRLASSFLLGATLSAMLLGHHYLTAPAMSIEPLKRYVRAMGWGLGARGLLGGIGLAYWLSHRSSVTSDGTVSALFLAMRWGMGIAGPAAAAWMTWETVRIRSTQSATGILYIGMTLVLFGELTAMVLSRDTGILF